MSVKKKRLLSMVVAFTLLMPAMAPIAGHALSLSDIDKQLAEIKQQEDKLASQKKQAEQQKAEVSSQKQTTQQDIKQLLDQIDQQSQKLDDLNDQIAESTAELEQTGKQLEDAENRVSERKNLLDARLRLTYMNGFVTYMDVLLQANSFSDFLGRFGMLKSIIGQDETILAANQQDMNLIDQKKQEVSAHLSEIKNLYAEASDVKGKLQDQENAKERYVSVLSAKEKKLEGISEDAEKAAEDLAAQKEALYAKKNELSVKFTGGTMVWPTPGYYRITSPFGAREDPINGKPSYHKGVDIGAPWGAKIVAAESGVVIVAQWVSGFGYTVIINHGNGYWTWYGHMHKGGIAVKEGQEVKAGQKIGEVGATGRATGPHLHFQVTKDRVPIDPMQFFTSKKES